MTQTRAAGTATSLLAHQRMGTIAKSMIGSIFEWYQFSIFGYFAPIMGKVFFPNDVPSVQLLLAYGTFFAGYLARPIGGLLFGIMGDRYGRKHVLVWTLLLMAIPSVLMGLLPGYASIGMAAPILLVALRLLQGLSMGGNYGGSLTFVSEHSAKNRKGFTSSFAVISILIGLFLGSLTIAAFNTFCSADFIETIGFRLPFLIGVFVFLWGLYLQRTLIESPAFAYNQESGELPKNPLKTVFTQYRSSLLKLVSVVVLHDLSFYILFVFLTTHFTETFGLTKDMVFGINSISLLIVGASVLVSAWYSDQYGRKPIMLGAAIFFIVATIPLLSLVSHGANWWTVMGTQGILAVAVGVFLGPLPALMVETFPSSIRNTALTTTGNISGPIFGGSAPLVLTYLTQVTGIQMIPALYLTAAAIIALCGLMVLKAPYRDDD